MPGVLKLFLWRAGWDSSVTWKGQNCFWRGGGGGKNMCANRTSLAQSTKSLAAGVQGPLKGPGSSGVIDALWCNLSLILDHLQFVWTLFFITFTAIFYAFYMLYNCNNFVIYKMITIIVIILDPQVLKRTWNWGDNAVKDNEWSRIDRHDSKLAEFVWEQGRSYGGGGAWGAHAPTNSRCPPTKKNHAYIFFICQYHTCVNTLRPHKNHAYAFLKYMLIMTVLCLCKWLFLPIFTPIPYTRSDCLSACSAGKYEDHF